MKAMVYTGVLQGDSVGPNILIICLDYALQPSMYEIKENRLAF